jgi:hypothetical protein
MGPISSNHKVRVTTDSLKCPDWRIHSPGDEYLSITKKLKVGL